MAIKVIVQNHNSGNRVFPGWSSQYPELANVPGNTIKDRALIVSVEDEDVEEVIAALSKRGVSAKLPEHLSGRARKNFEIWFPALFAESDGGRSEELREFYNKQYKELLKELDADAKAEWKDFEPKQASLEELEKNIKQLEAYVKNLKTARDEWEKGVKALNRPEAKALREDVARKLDKKSFNPAKAGLEDMQTALTALSEAPAGEEKGD